MEGVQAPEGVPEPEPEFFEANYGHGWVIPRRDNALERCGGPPKCPKCTAEKAYAEKQGLRFETEWRVTVELNFKDHDRREFSLDASYQFCTFPGVSSVIRAIREIGCPSVLDRTDSQFRRAAPEMVAMGLPEIERHSLVPVDKTYYFAGLPIGKVKITPVRVLRF